MKKFCCLFYSVAQRIAVNAGITVALIYQITARIQIITAVQDCAYGKDKQEFILRFFIRLIKYKHITK